MRPHTEKGWGVSENRVGESAKIGVHCGQCEQQVQLPHTGGSVACSGNGRNGTAGGRPDEGVCSRVLEELCRKRSALTLFRKVSLTLMGKIDLMGPDWHRERWMGAELNQGTGGNTERMEMVMWELVWQLLRRYSLGAPG